MPSGGGSGRRSPGSVWHWPRKTGDFWLGKLAEEKKLVAHRIVLAASRDGERSSFEVDLSRLTGEELEALQTALPDSLGHWMRNNALARLRRQLREFIQREHPLVRLAREAP